MVALLPQKLMIFYVTLRKNSFLTQINVLPPGHLPGSFVKQPGIKQTKKYVIITTLQPASAASSGSVSHSDHSSWTAKLKSAQERKDPLKRPASRCKLSLPCSQPRSQKRERPAGPGKASKAQAPSFSLRCTKGPIKKPPRKTES